MRKRPEPVTVDLNRRACFVSRPKRERVEYSTCYFGQKEGGRSTVQSRSVVIQKKIYVYCQRWPLKSISLWCSVLFSQQHMQLLFFKEFIGDLYQKLKNRISVSNES